MARRVLCLLALSATMPVFRSEDIVSPQPIHPAPSPLDELKLLFLDATFMATLPRLRSDCAANVIGKMSFPDCDGVEYLHEVEAYLSKYSSGGVAPAQAPVGKKKAREPKVAPFVDVSQVKNTKLTTYAQLFENFIMKGRPFKGRFESPLSLLGQTDVGLVAKCLADVEAHPFSGDVSIQRCREHLNLQDWRVTVPKIAANSYLYRISIVDAGLHGSQGTSNHLASVPLASHWPATFNFSHLDPPTPVHQCPANMHMVLWSTASSPLNFLVRAFHQSAATRFGISWASKSTPPHYPRFERDGFTGPNDLPNYSEMNLGPSEYMFLPANLVVSFSGTLPPHSSTAAKAPSSEQTQLIRMCFVDASNFHGFQKYLDFVGKVSDYEAAVAALVHSPSFPTHMNRVANDSDHFALTRLQLTPAVVGEVGESDAGMQASDQLELPPPPKRDRSNRQNRGSRGGGGGRSNSAGVFKDWQETNKWHKMIKSLTMPKPAQPTVTSIGRNNCTLEWQSVFLPDETDKTRFGFNITLCPLTSRDDEELAPSCRFLVLERSESEGQKQLRERILPKKARNGSLTTMDNARIFAVDILDLSPASRYRFRMNLFFDTFHSLPSDWSMTFVTQALSPPSAIPGKVLLSPHGCTSLTISTTPPFDNGGSDIFGYIVYYRLVEPGYFNRWRYGGIHRHELADVRVGKR